MLWERTIAQTLGTPRERQTMGNSPAIDRDALSALCRRWQVQELALFGSAARGNFGPHSDVDVLVTFVPDAGHSLFDLMRLQDELEALLGRPVDLVEKRALRNPFLRHEILQTARVLYAA
jgi:predicted nucleotidyltransferase